MSWLGKIAEWAPTLIQYLPQILGAGSTLLHGIIGDKGGELKKVLGDKVTRTFGRDMGSAIENLTGGLASTAQRMLKRKTRDLTSEIGSYIPKKVQTESTRYDYEAE